MHTRSLNTPPAWVAGQGGGPPLAASCGGRDDGSGQRVVRDVGVGTTAAFSYQGDVACPGGVCAFSGHSNYGRQAWWFKRGYQSPGLGTPCTPLLHDDGTGGAGVLPAGVAAAEPGGGGSGRPRAAGHGEALAGFGYSVRFRAGSAEHDDGSQMLVVAAPVRGT